MMAVGALLAVLPTSAPAAAQGPMCFGQPATIVAQPGVTTVGTSGPDVIYGTSGPDVIRGRGGADLICSRGGADDVKGGSGNDMIDLGKGGDTAEGGKGRDTIYGRSGADTIEGNSGRDTIYGNKGRDVLRGGKSGDTIVGGSGRDTIRGQSGKDDCRGGSALDDLRSCNEATDEIDIGDAHLAAADLAGLWGEAGRSAVLEPLLLRVCGKDLENDIGITDFGTNQTLAPIIDGAPGGVLNHSVRIQTERTAQEIVTRTANAIEDCSWEVRDDANGLTSTYTMTTAPALVPRGESSVVYTATQELDFDGPGDSTAQVAIIQIQCGPVISRAALQIVSGSLDTAMLNDIAGAAEAKLAAALAGTGYSC